MQFIVWLIRIVVFVLLFLLAIANTQEITLNFVAGTGYAWRAPLILIGFAFFAVGLIVGLLAVLPVNFRQRLAISRLKRELKTKHEAPVAHQSETPPPLA